MGGLYSPEMNLRRSVLVDGDGWRENRKMWEEKERGSGEVGEKSKNKEKNERENKNSLA
jgi:hypothetical protein